MKSVDVGLLEVCNVYNIPRKKMIKSLYVPTVTPYFTSALLSSIGLGWKAGIAAEVLCTPVRSIGKAIFESKIYFEYVDLFAWTAAVIVLSLIFEVLLTKLLKKLLSKYTKNPGGSDGN
jgi:NitT/TauT family transport system permease protein